MAMSQVFWSPKAAAEKLLIDLKTGKAESVSKHIGSSATFEIFNVSERYQRSGYLLMSYQGGELESPNQVNSACLYARQSDANRVIERLSAQVN